MSSSSSTVSHASRYERSKFTRGEKCIFIHLIITFCMILVLVLIYFIHLCVINHSLRDVWKITRRKTTKAEHSPDFYNYPVGHVYVKDLPVRLLCNAILLRSQWSVAPAHCVAIRTDPDMAYLLLSWRIRYAYEDNFVETKIKRTIPHPHFDREDFRNNVGLLEHESPIRIQHFKFLDGKMGINDHLLLQNANRLALFGWIINSTVHEDELLELVRYEVQPIPSQSCARFMTPILDIRTYEYCVLFRQRDDDIIPYHGSVFVVDSTVMGFFAWGEKSGKGVPYIVLDLRHFKTWLENIIAW